MRPPAWFACNSEQEESELADLTAFKMNHTVGPKHKWSNSRSEPAQFSLSSWLTSRPFVAFEVDATRVVSYYTSNDLCLSQICKLAHLGQR